MRMYLGWWWEVGVASLHRWGPCQLQHGAHMAPTPWESHETGSGVWSALSKPLIISLPCRCGSLSLPGVAISLRSPTPHPKGTLQTLGGHVAGSGQRLTKEMGAGHLESLLPAGHFGPEDVMGEARTWAGELGCSLVTVLWNTRGAVGDGHFSDPGWHIGNQGPDRGPEAWERQSPSEHLWRGVPSDHAAPWPWVSRLAEF